MVKMKSAAQRIQERKDRPGWSRKDSADCEPCEEKKKIKKTKEVADDGETA